jgi:hypothetical protein
MADTNTSNDQDFSSMEERNEQTLADIRNLQQIEQELYNSLEKNTNGNNITSEEKDQILKKISEISQMRVNLYANLQETYSFFQKNVASSRTTLAEQMMAIDIVENELKDSKRKLQLLEDEKYNKLRLVEINTYYGKQYNAHSGLMKTIVIICIPILIISILKNSGILPTNIASVIISVIIIIGLIYIGRQIIDMSNRDNMNYDEYDWHFNKSDAPSDGTPSDTTDPWATPSLVCVGAQCCNEFSTYDAEQNLCIPNIPPSSSSQ